MKERGALGDAGSLLHVMRDDHDGVFLAQLINQVLHMGRGDGI